MTKQKSLPSNKTLPMKQALQTRHWPRQLKGLSASSYQFVLIHGCHGAVMFSTGLAQGRNKADLKSLFQKSPLKSRAVHGATICDVILPNNT